jgi:hypothetical protein
MTKCDECGHESHTLPCTTQIATGGIGVRCVCQIEGERPPMTDSFHRSLYKALRRQSLLTDPSVDTWRELVLRTLVRPAPETTESTS